MWIERTVRYKSTRRLSRRQLWCAYICLYLLMMAVVIWASIYLASDPENYRWHQASVSIVPTGNHTAAVVTAPAKFEVTQQEHEIVHPGMAPQELHYRPNISQENHIKPEISQQKPGVIIGADMGHLQTMKPQVVSITFRYTQKFTQQIRVNISRNITSHLVAIPQQLVVEEDEKEEAAAARPTTTGGPDTMTAAAPAVDMQQRPAVDMQQRPAVDAIKRRPAENPRALASVRGSRLAGSEHQLQRKILLSAGRKKEKEKNNSQIAEVSGTLIKNSLEESTGGPQLREGIRAANEFDEGTEEGEEVTKEILEVPEISDSRRRDGERDEDGKIGGLVEFREGNSSIAMGDSRISTVNPELAEEIERGVVA